MGEWLRFWWSRVLAWAWMVALGRWRSRAGGVRTATEGSCCASSALRAEPHCPTVHLSAIPNAPHPKAPQPKTPHPKSPHPQTPPPNQANEREALSKVAGLEAQLEAAHDEPIWLRRQLQEREAELASQRAVNRQLMAKKEDVEWCVGAVLVGVGVVWLLCCYGSGLNGSACLLGEAQSPVTTTVTTTTTNTYQPTHQPINRRCTINQPTTRHTPRQLMSAVAALQAAGLSSNGLAPPPLTLNVAGSLNLDQSAAVAAARKRDSSGGGGARGALTSSLGRGAAGVQGETLCADVEGGADTCKRWQEQELGLPIYRTSSSGNGHGAELHLMPSLELGIGPGAAAGASVAPALQTVDEAAAGGAAGEGFRLLPPPFEGAPGALTAAAEGSGVRLVNADTRSPSRPPAAAGYGEEEMFSIRRREGGGLGSPIAAHHPAMGPARLSAGVVAATAAPALAGGL